MTQKPELSEAAEPDGVGLILVPPRGGCAVEDMPLDHDRQPDVDVRKRVHRRSDHGPD